MQYVRLLLFYSVIFQSVIFQSCKFQSCKFSYPLYGWRYMPTAFTVFKLLAVTKWNDWPEKLCKLFILRQNMKLRSKTIYSNIFKMSPVLDRKSPASGVPSSAVAKRRHAFWDGCRRRRVNLMYCCAPIRHQLPRLLSLNPVNHNRQRAPAVSRHQGPAAAVALRRDESLDTEWWIAQVRISVRH